MEYEAVGFILLLVFLRIFYSVYVSFTRQRLKTKIIHIMAEHPERFK